MFFVCLFVCLFYDVHDSYNITFVQIVYFCMLFISLLCVFIYSRTLDPGAIVIC